MSTAAVETEAPMNYLYLSSKPIELVEEFFRVNGDKRVAELRFMDSPWAVLAISAFYIYFSYDLGPQRLMARRPAFNLVWTVRVFNTLILLLNVWLLTKYFALLNWGLSSIGCKVSIWSLLAWTEKPVDSALECAIRD